MDILMNKFKIELNNLIEDYREKGIPAFVLSGVVAQEQLMLKEREMAEMIVKLSKSNKEENSDEQSVQPSELAESAE